MVGGQPIEDRTQVRVLGAHAGENRRVLNLMVPVERVAVLRPFIAQRAGQNRIRDYPAAQSCPEAPNITAKSVMGQQQSGSDRGAAIVIQQSSNWNLLQTRRTHGRLID